MQDLDFCFKICKLKGVLKSTRLFDLKTKLEQNSAPYFWSLPSIVLTEDPQVSVPLVDFVGYRKYRELVDQILSGKTKVKDYDSVPQPVVGWCRSDMKPRMYKPL